MEENNYSVYVHTNKHNNKKYVGLTKKRPKDRWQRGNGYTHSIYFYSAIQKYGWDGFYHDVVADCLSKEEASTLERELIKEYKTTNRIYGYNLNQGGFVGGNTNHSTRENHMCQQAEIKLAINYNGAGISACCKHSRITAGGYKWQYVDEHEGRVA